MATETPLEDSVSVPDSLQMLTFVLEDGVYGTDIGQIQEVLEYRKVTPVPRTPDFMLGVINLRGNVVPVVDLRRLFGMHLKETTVDTCIIIVEVMVDDEKTPMGILADAVKQVISLGVGQVSPPPRIGSRIDTRYISGMGKRDEEFIVILNLPKVFSNDKIGSVISTLNESDSSLLASLDSDEDVESEQLQVAS